MLTIVDLIAALSLCLTSFGLGLKCYTNVVTVVANKI